MKPSHVLLQLLAMATAGGTISLPKATSETGQLLNERKSPADATDAKAAVVYPRGTDGGDVWQRSAADAEMDADDAVVYPDGTDGTQTWA